MVIEYARNVLGVKDAEHAEYDPYSSNLFISKLDCSLAGRALELQLVSGSRVAKIYQSTSVTENYYCNFGVAPKHESRLSSDSGISVTGSDTEGKIRVIELNDHPFFIGTLFVPQMRSTSDNPHPLVTEFVRQAGTC